MTTSPHESPPVEPDPPEASRPEGLTTARLMAAALREWRLTLGITGAAALAATAGSLAVPPRYTASVAFLPQTQSPTAALGGLAAIAERFGTPAEFTSFSSPHIYDRILHAGALYRTLLLDEFSVTGDTASDSTSRLLDILPIPGDTEGERLEAGIRRLDKMTGTSVDARSSVVTLRVTGRPPALMAEIANRMIAELNHFNLERRRSQSGERRRFVGERLAEAERELLGAEDEHRRFLESNRQFEQSPLLAFEENRLARRVQLRQELFTTLSTEYEQARIAEAQDTPVLTVIDPAVPPDRKSFPPRKLIVALATLAGGALALTLVALREYSTAAERGGDGDYLALKRAWWGARQDLSSALRRPKRT